MPQISGRFDGDKAVKGLTRAEGKPQDPTMPKKQKYTKKYNTWKTGKDFQEGGEMDARDIEMRRKGTPIPFGQGGSGPVNPRDVYPKDEL